jgi:hypothetical protein
MDGDEVKKLKVDRRLIGRRGWISPEELEAALEALPDSAHKAKRPGEESSGDPDEATSD